MTGIHQILAGASPGDAITNAAFEIRDTLRAACASEVYARHVTPALAGEVRSLTEFPSRATGDVLVYHASIGEPAVCEFLFARPEPVVLCYHNVTPASYFAAWDPEFADLLDLGRRELVELRPRVALAIADSHYNASELEAVGYRDVRVIPPVIDPYRLTRVDPSPAAMHHLRENIARPVMLFVGQLLPHKRVDLLVEAAHLASRYLGLDAFLMLVGHQRLPAYTAAIARQVLELSAVRVHLVGQLPDDELAAMFRSAAVWVTASEHEGFCVPVLEAMAFGLPVVARACGAIPETLGDGGLLLPADSGPELVAEAMAEVVRRRSTRERLTARARARAAAFDAGRTRVELLQALLEVV